MNSKLIVSIALFSLALITATAQSDSLKRPAFSEIKTVFQQLQHYQQLVIKTNLDSLAQKKYKESIHEAHLLAFGKNQPTLELPIKIEARGKYRRRICDIPPIKLNFSKTQLDTQGIYPIYDKLKLVTFCFLEEGQETQQTLLKEYWTYKMYSQLTSNSFKVHLVDMIYMHSEDSRRKIKSQAFVIESPDEVAHRLDGEIVEESGNIQANFEQESYLTVALFNYMIGNTDWNIRIQKNVKFLKSAANEQLILLPYDFDFSALTNASYFRLTPVEGVLPNKKNRVLIGNISDEILLEKIINHFLELNKESFWEFEKSERLLNTTKEEMRLYLQPFFQLLKKEKKWRKAFLTE